MNSDEETGNEIQNRMESGHDEITPQFHAE